MRYATTVEEVLSGAAEGRDAIWVHESLTRKALEALPNWDFINTAKYDENTTMALIRPHMEIIDDPRGGVRVLTFR